MHVPKRTAVRNTVFFLFYFTLSVVSIQLTKLTPNEMDALWFTREMDLKSQN